MTVTEAIGSDSASLARDRLAGALDAVCEGVVVCDEAGEVVYQNARASVVMGVYPVDLLAERAVVDMLASAGAEIQSRTLELYGPPPRTLTIVASPIEDDSGRLGGVAVIEDVSDRRHLEAVRRDFVANISHELKTPVGALALLAETLAGESDHEVVNRLARRLQLESQRVARIVDDLLDLSRIESEKSPVREPVPVRLVVSQAVDRMRPAAEQRSVAIRSAELPEWLTIMGDRRQLVSAVFNLLENAVKYSDSATTVDVGFRRLGDWIELDVIDRGIGIPDREIERIFERFYRVDRGRSRDTGGTGLGLAIVRHVAKSHGGEVRVLSREGEGSTFTLRLPVGTPSTTASNAV